MNTTTSPGGSYLARLPFKSGDGFTRYCVEGVMTDAPDADGVFSVTYCVDCMGQLGAAELVYGAGAQKCMQCGSVFLRRQTA